MTHHIWKPPLLVLHKHGSLGMYGCEKVDPRVWWGLRIALSIAWLDTGALGTTVDGYYAMC